MIRISWFVWYTISSAYNSLSRLSRHLALGSRHIIVIHHIHRGNILSLSSLRTSAIVKSGINRFIYISMNDFRAYVVTPFTFFSDFYRTLVCLYWTLGRRGCCYWNKVYTAEIVTRLWKN